MFTVSSVRVRDRPGVNRVRPMVSMARLEIAWLGG